MIQEAPRSSNEVRDLIKAWRPLGCIVDMNESNRCFTDHSLGSTPTTFLDFDNLQSRGRTFRVNHNPDAVGALAARHLLSLNLTHFAFVGYTREWGWSEDRRKSFLDHLGDSADSFQSFAFPITADMPADTRRQFLNWLEALPRPCGLLLAYDGLAREVYPACAKLNLRIPDDIAILGVDDNERFCGNLRPTLSSILLDFSQAGWMAAELLHRAIRNPMLTPFVQSYEPLGIAPRKSTAVRVNRTNPIAGKAQKLIAEAENCGINAFTITGGEPMLHPHFMDIIRGIYAHGMYVEELNTNGFFITQKILDEMKEIGCRPLMKISFDGIGHHDWLRNREGAEEDTLRAIRMCVENGFRVKAQTNVHRLNVGSMLPTAKLLDSMGVSEMRIIRTTESPRWRQNAGDACLTPEEYFDTAIRFSEAYARTDNRMDIDIWQLMHLWKQKQK